MNTLNQILRSLLIVTLTVVGVIMATIFMVSTALAVGILYVVARIKGRPFGVRAYWEERQRAAPRPAARFNKKDVVDVELREIR